MSRKSPWLIISTLVFLAALVLSPPSVQGQESSFGQRLILNVYLDITGKGLVTGYADNVSGLAFLNTSQYRFENDTHQLYALTDGLTTKNGDLWTMRFASCDYYDDYHVTFYLPGYLKLGKISVTDGLNYLLSASNESLVVDVQGYEAQNPTIAIDYQQPLAVNPPPPAVPPGFASNDFNLTTLLIILALLVLGSGLAFFIMRLKNAPGNGSSPRMDAEVAAPIEPPSHSDQPEGVSPESEQADDGVYPVETAEPMPPGGSEEYMDSVADSVLKNKIEVSSEMEAVMQTLTAREHAVITTLIDHGGRMTQAEIRYETGTPKSSLTGILTSLERRKLITKKEWGRTNIIELSEWFLSQKEPS